MPDETPEQIPAEGGSYLRRQDGALERVVEPTAEAAPPPTEPQGPPAITPDVDREPAEAPGGRRAVTNPDETEA